VIPTPLEYLRKPSSAYVTVILFAMLLFKIASGMTGRSSMWEHDPFDQFTRQASAWIQGRSDIDPAPAYLEFAKFEGKTYCSFPPAPSLIEVPLVFLFGGETPNLLALYLFCSLALLAMVRLCLEAKLSSLGSTVIPLWFVFGSNVASSLAYGKVWAYGQVYGFAFGVFALYWIMRPRPSRWAYFFLALAVGCRPFYAALFPLLALIDLGKRPEGGVDRSWLSVRKVALKAASGGAHVLLAILAYNFVRFGKPFEFGHRYLPWSQSLEHGIFSFRYFWHDFTHAFLVLPSWSARGRLEFDGAGTAFWINNWIVALGLAAIGKGTSPRSQKLAAGGAVLLIWGALLTHESNGWFQFGYRYIIDLMPLALFGILSLRGVRRSVQWVGLALMGFSVAINYYGIWWLAHP
jgi:hypothetical protein